MPITSKTTQAGDLKKPIHILQRRDTFSQTGGSDDSYTDVFGGVVWAQDHHGKSNVLEAGGRVVSTTLHSYTVRYTTKIKQGMYIQDPDYPVLFYIHNITDPLRNKQWIELSATDVEP